MRNLFGWSVVAVMIFGGVAGAQQVRPGTQPVQPVQPGTVRPGVQPGVVRPGNVQPGNVQPGAGQPGAQNQSEQYTDQQIAAIIAICNRTEVEVVKFALPKLKSDKAKELATTMIKDHTAAADKFGRLAGQLGAVSTSTRREGDLNDRREEGRREGDRRDNDRSDAKSDVAAPRETPANAATAPNNPGTRVVAQAPGNTAAGQPARQPGAQPGQQPAGQPRTALRPVSGGGLNWVSIQQEIADECLAGCKKELSKYEGNDFDKAFLGSQLAGHMRAATELKVFSRHASSQLSSEIDDALATTETHIKHLRELMDEKKDEK